MTDSILAAGQQLLRKQMAHMVCTALPWADMCIRHSKEYTVPILSNGYDHWLTVSTVGAEGTVNVYDSLYVSVGSIAKYQIAAIVNTELHRCSETKRYM